MTFPNGCKPLELLECLWNDSFFVSEDELGLIFDLDIVAAKYIHIMTSLKQLCAQTVVQLGLCDEPGLDAVRPLLDAEERKQQTIALLLDELRREFSILNALKVTWLRDNNALALKIHNRLTLQGDKPAGVLFSVWFHMDEPAEDHAASRALLESFQPEYDENDSYAAYDWFITYLQDGNPRFQRDDGEWDVW